MAYNYHRRWATKFKSHGMLPPSQKLEFKTSQTAI